VKTPRQVQHPAQVDAIEPSSLSPLTGSAEGDVSPAIVLASSPGLDAVYSALKDLPQLQKQLVDRAARGLAAGEDPEPIDDGEGATYMLRDEQGTAVGVFKPADGEPAAEQNPKRRGRDAEKEEPLLKKGVLPGEGAVREFAAYMLDRGHFAGVPPTLLVKARLQPGGPLRLGSLQQFVQHDHQSWDIGPSNYSHAEVHRIGIFDLRLLNTDRHGGNILVKKIAHKKYRLHPIDHGFLLPDTLSVPELWFEWMTWPQAKVPFDQDTVSYVRDLSPVDDALLLRQLGVRPACILSVLRATQLLKRAVARGLTLHQIGALFTRGDPDRPSALESMSKVPCPEDPLSRGHLAALEHAADLYLSKHNQRSERRSGGGVATGSSIATSGSSSGLHRPSAVRSPTLEETLLAEQDLALGLTAASD